MQLLHFLQIYSYNAAFYKTMPFQKIQKALQFVFFDISKSQKGKYKN